MDPSKKSLRAVVCRMHSSGSFQDTIVHGYGARHASKTSKARFKACFKSTLQKHASKARFQARFRSTQKHALKGPARFKRRETDRERGSRRAWGQTAKVLDFLSQPPKSRGGLPGRPVVGCAVSLQLDLEPAVIDEWFQ